MSDDNTKTFMIFTNYHKNIVNLIRKAGLEFNENTVKEIIGGLKVSGIGTVKLNQMKEDYDAYMASKAKNHQPSITSKDRKAIVNPTIFAESFSVDGETLYQAQTAASRAYGTTQSLIFGDKILVQNPALFNLLGYSVLNKHNRFQEVTVEEGNSLRDHIVLEISDRNKEFDPGELKKTLVDYAKINPGLNPYATLTEDTTLKVPPHGKVASTVFNIGNSQSFLLDQQSLVRGQAYSSFVASAVSKKFVEDVCQMFGAKVYFFTQKKYNEFAESLQGKITFEYLCSIDENVSAYLEWADGKHLMSKGLFKLLGSILVQGRTYTFKNVQRIKKLQLRVNKLGARLNNFRKLYNKFFGKIGYDGWKAAFKFLNSKEFLGEKGKNGRLPSLLYKNTKKIAVEHKLNNSPSKEVLNEARLKVLGLLGSIFEEEIAKSKVIVKGFEEETFSKGLYSFPHKNYVPQAHNNELIVWLHPTDVKTKNKRKIKNLFIEQVKKAFKPGMINQVDGTFIEMKAGKTAFSLMDIPEVRKTSFGHQYSMWFKSFSSMTEEEQASSIFKSAEDQENSVKRLLDLTMEYHGISDWVEFAKQRALGPKENKASYDALAELGRDWFLTPKGNETLANTLEGCLTSFFKGAYYEPQDSVFVAPNPFHAEGMVPDSVQAIIPWPKHLVDAKGNPLVKVDHKGFEAIIGRYPSNNAENPVKCRVFLHRKGFSIYSKKELIDPLVADIDGDRGSEIIHFPIKPLVEALDLELTLEEPNKKRVKALKKAIAKQKIWNSIIRLCEFKTISEKFYIEDLCPIDVEKTSKSVDWWNDSASQIAKMMDYFTWPNQAPVGPPANHVQTASLNDLMSVAFSCKSGTTLQNYIDSQKSLNDYPWLNEKTIVDSQGRHSLPSVKDWKRLSLKEVQSVLLESPDYWTEEENEGKDFWCLHPEILLPVNIKVFVSELAKVSIGDYVAATFEGKLYGEDEEAISEEIVIHKDWITFIKANDPCLPNIRSLTHYFNFSLQFPDGYSQRKTPWHADSRGDYVFSWLAPKEYPLDEEYCSAGDNSVLGLQFDELVERAVFDLPEISESIFAGYDFKVSQEVNDFLKSFNAHQVNAYTPAAIPEAVSKEIVKSFGRVLPYIKISYVNSRREKIKGYWLQKKLGLSNAVYAKLVQDEVFGEDFWNSEILPFGFKYADIKGERPFGNYCSQYVKQTLLKIKTGDAEAAQQRHISNLKEVDRWVSIKKSAQTLFEFFATQSFGGCSLWSETKKDIKKNKTTTDDWAKVQVQLELKHDHALHKCKACQRQFLSWATKGSTSTADWQFCQTIEFVVALDKNLWAMDESHFSSEGLKALFEVETQKGFNLDLNIDSAIVDLREGKEIDFASHREDPTDDDWFDDEDSDEDSMFDDEDSKDEEEDSEDIPWTT